MSQHHVVVVVVVEHGDGRQADGDAAGLRCPVRVQGVDQGLQDGVVGAVEAFAEGEGTLAVAVVGHVALRGDDPVLPAHVFEVDVEASGLAHVGGRHGEVDGASPLSGATLVGVEGHGDQRGLDQRQRVGRLQWEGVARVERKKLLWLRAERQQLDHQTVVTPRLPPVLRQGREVQGEGRGLGLHLDRLGQQESAVGLGIGSSQRGSDHPVQRDAEGPGPLQELRGPERFPVELDLQLSQRQQLHRLQDGHVEEQLLLHTDVTAAAPPRHQPACSTQITLHSRDARVSAGLGGD